MVNFFTLIIVIGIAGIWFFTKKKPDKQKRLISIIVSVLAFLGFGLLTELDKKDNDSKNKVAESTVKETTSSSVVETIETSESKSEKKQSKESPKDENNEEYNKEIAENLDLKKGWAIGSIDKDGNPTDSGEPNDEYTVWLLVNEIKINDPKNIDVKVTADFNNLTKSEKDEMASTIQGMVLSATVADGETKRYPVYFYNGENALGGSKALEPTEFKWNK